MKTSAVVALLIVAAALAGGAVALGRSGGTAIAHVVAPTPVAVHSCILGAGGADVEVKVTGTPGTCTQWVTALAPTGLNWHFLTALAPPYTAGPADGEQMYKVCVLSGSDGNMVVEDAGSASYGTSICSQEEANGWTPHESTQG